MEFIEVDGLVVKLKLNGACGSCPSSLTTMTMGIKRRLMERIPVGGERAGVVGSEGPGVALVSISQVLPAPPSHMSHWHWLL